MKNTPLTVRKEGNRFVRRNSEDSVCSILELTASDGKKYDTKIYNLDAIISVGYRVNSINATLFRRWATEKLRDYLLKGYAINTRIDRIENRVDEEVYHIGASLKDLGKKWFAFSKMDKDSVAGIIRAVSGLI